MMHTRRSFLKTALAMPIGASLAYYEAIAAPAQGEMKITAIKTIRLKGEEGDVLWLGQD